MSEICSKGDVVTFLEEGTAKLSFGSGRKADTLHVGPGYFHVCVEDTRISDVKCHVARCKLERTARQRMYNPQPVRECTTSLASLEIPTLQDPAIVELEAKLEQRGQALKARMLEEAERLKNGS